MQLQLRSLYPLAAAALAAAASAPARAALQEGLSAGGALVPGRVAYGAVAEDDPSLAGYGPARRFELAVEAAGPVTLTALSYDFDAYLRVVDADGRLLAEDDDDGFETNPRVVVALRPGRYGVIVAAPASRAGGFEVRAELGAQPALEGLALHIVRTGFLQQSLERAIDRGDEAEAGRIGVRLGNALHATRQCAEAQRVLRTARERLVAADDVHGTAEADLELGRILLALGGYPGAAERFERALVGFRDLGDRAGAAAAVLGLGDVHARRSETVRANDRYVEALELADQLAEPELRSASLARQGALALALGEHARARELFDARLETARKLTDRLHVADAVADLGRLELALRACEPALAALDDALATYRELGAVQGEAQALLELGRARLECGAVDGAREALDEALALARDAQLAELEVVALHNLGTYWEDLQRVDLAREAYVGALAEAERLALQGEVRQLTALVGSLLVGTDLDAAFGERPRLLRTLAEAEAAGDLQPAATLLRVLTALDRRTGNLDGAARHAERARALYDRVGWDDALLRVEEGWIAYERGDPEGAQGIFEALGGSPGAEASLPPIAELQVAEGLGRLAVERGAYLAAYRRFDRRLELARTLALLDEEARALRDLGSIAIQLGRPAVALEQLQRATELQARVVAQDPFDAIGLHVELGRAYTSLDEYRLAEDEFEAARALAEEHGIAAATLFAIEGVAYLRLQTEEYVDSLALHREALELARSLGAERHVPVLLGNLSAVYLGLESYVAARRHAEDALAAAAALPAWDPTYALEPLHTLAVLARTEGLVDEGFAYLDEAYQRVVELRAQAVRAGLGLGSAASTWLQKLDRVYQDLARQRERDRGRPPTEAELAEAFQRADAARARDLLSGIVQLERGARSPEAGARRAELEELYATWTELAAARRDALREPDATGAAGDPATLRRQADTLLRRIESVELALARISPPDAALGAHDGASPEELRATVLGPGRALVLYAEGQVDLYAYVLSSERLSVHRLGSRRSIADQAARYVALISDRRTLGTAAEVAELGSELYRELCARPLDGAGDAAGGGLRELVVVPTPGLAGLPFGALVESVQTGAPGFDGVAFLADRCVVSYGPAGSVLVRTAERGPHKRDGKVLVLADPIYGESAGPDDAATQAGTVEAAVGATRAGPDLARLPRLEQTRTEAFAVAEPIVRASDPGALPALEALRSRRSGALEASTIDLFVGAEASSARLFESSLLPYGWIHLAVHGTVDAGTPNRTGVVLAAGGDAPAFVAVPDILALQLDAELVVLSACDTASGTRRDGDGIESMASAFLYAGARSVIASLWQVDDAVTAQTMRAFYAGVLGTTTPAAVALHEAQTAVRTLEGDAVRTAVETVAAGAALGLDPRHPYLWAAFVHIGRSTD